MTTTRAHQHHRLLHGSRTAPLLFLLLASLLCSAAAQPSVSRSADDYPNNVKPSFNPAMGIIVVALISSFFFMAFFSIYLRQCSRRGDASAMAGGAAGGGRGAPRRAAPRGLDPAVIATFPTLVYAEVKEHQAGKGALECAVCLSEFEDDEALRLLPKCDHVFHPDCIDAWLSSHTTCPVCRANLSPDAQTPTTTSYPLPVPPSTETPMEAPEQDSPVDGRQQQQDHVAITIDEEETGEREQDRAALPRMARRQRWWSKSLGRHLSFSRSISMGHSSAAPGTSRPGDQDRERYTLRLPTHIRKDIMAGKFQKSSSFAAIPGGWAGGEETSRAGGAVGGRSFKLGRWEWAAKSDRWAFFSRTFSMQLSRGDDGGGAGMGPARSGEVSTPKGGEAAGAGAGEGSGDGKVFPL